MLGVRVSTIRSHISNARKYLRRVLPGAGGGETGMSTEISADTTGQGDILDWMRAEKVSGGAKEFLSSM